MAKKLKDKNGKDFLCISVATNETYMLGDEWKTRTIWHQLLLFGIWANSDSYLKKGCQVFVEGKIRTNEWKDEQGNNRQSTAIVVDFVKWLSKQDGQIDSPSKEAQDHLSELHKMLETSEVGE